MPWALWTVIAQPRERLIDIAVAQRPCGDRLGRNLEAMVCDGMPDPACSSAAARPASATPVGRSPAFRHASVPAFSEKVLPAPA